MLEKNMLELLNPWWKEGKVSRELAMESKRSLFSELKKLIKKRQITVITGLRRVGKSTLMYQLIQELLGHGVEPEKILYFSFDERIEDIIKIFEEYFQLVKVNWKKERCIVFFDEIQKLNDWSNKLKIIYDSFPNLKIIISGSGSFQLEKEAKINLAGRHFILELNPLSFREYLEFKKTKINLSRDKLWGKEIKEEFENYLLRPFPEIIKYHELTLIKSYIKDNIIEKVMSIDLSKKFKHVNEDLLTTLIEIFYDRPGTYLNLDELSNDLRVGKSTLIQHIYYLEFARLIRRIKNFRPNSRTVSKKMQRIYPFHWSLEFAWKGRISMETVVASLLDSKYYWRDKKREVDFLEIKERLILPIEVKEGISVSKGDIGNLLFFMKKFDLKEGIVIYSGGEEQITIENRVIRKTPLIKMFITD